MPRARRTAIARCACGACVSGDSTLAYRPYRALAVLIDAGGVSATELARARVGSSHPHVGGFLEAAWTGCLVFQRPAPGEEPAGDWSPWPQLWEARTRAAPAPASRVATPPTAWLHDPSVRVLSDDIEVTSAAEAVGLPTSNISDGTWAGREGDAAGAALGALLRTEAVGSDESPGEGEELGGDDFGGGGLLRPTDARADVTLVVVNGLVHRSPSSLLAVLEGLLRALSPPPTLALCVGLILDTPEESLPRLEMEATPSSSLPIPAPTATASPPPTPLPTSGLSLPTFWNAAGSPLPFRPLQSWQFDACGAPARAEPNRIVLRAQRVPGSTRADGARSWDLDVAWASGGGRAAALSSLLPELAFKIGRAAKYGA